MGIFVHRHAKAASLYNNIAVLHAQSDHSILEPKIQFKTNNGFIELVIKYPKVNSKTPIWVNISKIKRFKQFHDLGLKILAEKGFTPDIVHCNVMNPVGLIAKHWKKKHKIPYVITEHWTGYLESDGRYKKSLILKLTLPTIAKGAEIILPVSTDLKYALQKNRIGLHFEVIRNVVDTDLFFIQKEKKNSFLVVADLENEQKNISGIIEAFQAVKKIVPDVQLQIAGGGKDEKDLKTLVHSLKLDSQIHFHGRVSAQKLNNLLAQSYASLLFSNYENLPCVIVEAFAAGVPFISTNVGGIKEIFSNERGYLIEVKNQIELIESMVNVVNESWNSEVLRDYALNNFSYKCIGKEFHKVYQGILGK